MSKGIALRYHRVSTDAQLDHVSLENQSDLTLQLSSSLGYEGSKEYVWDEVGLSIDPDRLGLLQLRSAINDPRVKVMYGPAFSSGCTPLVTAGLLCEGRGTATNRCGGHRPGFYPIPTDAGGEGGMPMGKREEGRENPEKRAEPREIEPSDAAPDQAEEFPRMVVFDDTASAPSDGIAGTVLSGKADASEPLENTADDVVMDTGWYDHRGWNVRVVVLGGVPNRNRRRWFQRRLMNN